MGFFVQSAGFAAMIDGIDEYIDVALDDDAVYIVGTNVEYAVYQEYGTRYMEPQPYLRPAAREAQQNISNIVAQSSDLPDAVKQTALFVERRAKELAPVDTGHLRGSIRSERVQ